MRGTAFEAAVAATWLLGAGAAAAQERELSGVVSEVRPVEGTIRVKAGDGPDREVLVRSGTEIRVEGRTATVEEIHPGVEIRASLTEGEAPVARRIEVGPGLAAPEASKDAAQPGDPVRDAEDAARREAREPEAPDR